MKRILALLFVLSPMVATAKTMFVMHGGAGTITRQSMTPETEAQIRAKLEEALEASEAEFDAGQGISEEEFWARLRSKR